MKVRTPAFTLIELLVVVVLIGILTVIAAPDYVKFQQKLDLKSSTQIMHSGLNEAYSLARSRSKHYLLKVTTANPDQFTLHECNDLSDADGYNCTTSLQLIGTDGLRKLEGKTVVTSGAFTVKFLAPHGDIEILDPTDPTNATLLGVDELVINLDNNGLDQDLSLYAKSGLVTTDTP